MRSSFTRRPALSSVECEAWYRSYRARLAVGADRGLGHEEDARLRLVLPCEFWWWAVPLFLCGIGPNEFVNCARI